MDQYKNRDTSTGEKGGIERRKGRLRCNLMVVLAGTQRPPWGMFHQKKKRGEVFVRSVCYGPPI